jgi:hypothetical protein
MVCARLFSANAVWNFALKGTASGTLLRWKTAGQELNGNVTGWSISENSPELYYRERSIFSRHFVIPRDYLWPIQESDLLVNQNLVQNPNW